MEFINKIKAKLSLTRELSIGTISGILTYNITDNFTGYNIYFIAMISLFIFFSFELLLLSVKSIIKKIKEHFCEFNRLKEISKIYNKRKEKSTIGSFLKELNNFLFTLEKDKTVQKIEEKIEGKYFKVLSHFIDEGLIQLKTGMKISDYPKINDYEINFNIYNKRREKIGFAKVNTDKLSEKLILTLKECEREEEIYKRCKAVNGSIEVFEHEVAFIKQNYNFSNEIYKIAKNLKLKLEEEISNGSN